MREAHAALGRMALQRGDAGHGHPRVPRGHRARARGSAPRRITDLAESYFKGGRRAEATKQTLAALEIAPSYERAQDLLLKLVGDAVMRPGARPAPAAGAFARPAVVVAAVLALLAPSVRLGRAAADRGRRPLRRARSGGSSGSSTTTSPKARRSPQDFYGEPWYIDAPAAEQNLSRRIKTATSIQVEDPIVLTLDDPRLFNYPWIYIVEPGNLKLGETATSRPCASSCCAAAR